MQVKLTEAQLNKALEKVKREELAQTVHESGEGSLRPMVYTSMDGDDMKYVDFIRVFCYQHGAVPANPMATLGYYTSTLGHKGSKKEIIKDCYTLMLSCSELWIFGKNHFSLDTANDLPEGVLAEILVWLKHKPQAPIKSFTWKDVGIPKYVNASQWALTSHEAKTI